MDDNYKKADARTGALYSSVKLSTRANSQLIMLTAYIISRSIPL